MKRVILVDRNDNEIGLEEKISAHRKGLLHRAVSVYIFDRKGRLMLQQRAKGVYHSGLRWSNTCCTNCYEGETAAKAAHRSLKGEMGFDCKLSEALSTIYKADVGKGLVEHEYLHIFFGVHDSPPKLNGDEAIDWKWEYFDDLMAGIKANPERYSEWLKILVKGELPGRVREFLAGRKRGLRG